MPYSGGTFACLCLAYRLGVFVEAGGKGPKAEVHEVVARLSLRISGQDFPLRDIYTSHQSDGLATCTSSQDLSQVQSEEKNCTERPSFSRHLLQKLLSTRIQLARIRSLAARFHTYWWSRATPIREREATGPEIYEEYLQARLRHDQSTTFI